MLEYSLSTNMTKTEICVLGLGYIGLPTSSIFATRGKQVVGVDVVQAVVDTINDGRIHIEEPDLDVLVRAAVQSGNLVASTEPCEADIYIIAVPTPFHRRDDSSKVPDLSYVESATRSIAGHVGPGALVILESTSPVGTTEKVRNWLFDELSKVRPDFSAEDRDSVLFAHCPERILPGQMLKELVSNDRIAGGLTPAASQRAKELYECFCTGTIVLTDARTAEMAKLSENAYRDVNIAFANELSMICDRLGIDVWELIATANLHPRVNILQPGPGVGGHCIAVDPWFIVDAAPEEARLIRTAREVNDHKPEWVVEKVAAAASRFKNPVIACFGLAFKADIDDLRESPAVEITAAIADLPEATVYAVEPHVKELPKALEGKCELIEAREAIRKADILVLLVNHKSFVELGRTIQKEKVVIDSRGIW